MGLEVARISDIGEGVCCENDDHDATGIIITGSPNVYANGLQVARIGDIIISTSCGHERVGTIVSGSPNVYANGLQVARVSSHFTGCFEGTIMSGAPKVRTS